MRLTKFEHSCILVETSNHVALFDPGSMSETVLDQAMADFSRLDDIVISHIHSDHFSLPLIERLIGRFPEARITAPEDVTEQLGAAGITASSQPSEQIVFFESPHENVQPLFPIPPEIGVHYADLYTHPGDSHSFHETKAILALPITAPWGSSIRAIEVAFALHPEVVIPIHDWFWKDQVQTMMYNSLEKHFADKGIKFLKPKTGEPISLDISKEKKEQ